MIYLDTSCLLKLLREEPDSTHVRRAADAEDEVVVSSLTELETEVQLKAAALAAVSGEVGGDAEFRPVSFSSFASGGFPDRTAAASASTGGLLPFIGPTSPRRDRGIETD